FGCGVAEFRGSRSIALSCDTKITTLPAAILRLRCRSVCRPSLGLRSSAAVPTAPRLKCTVVVEECAEDLNDERPRPNRLAMHRSVVLGVRGQCVTDVAWNAAAQLHRRKTFESLQLHRLLAS